VSIEHYSETRDIGNDLKDADQMSAGLCKSCKYWRSFDDFWGYCHRYAPRPNVGGLSTDRDVVWAQTRDIDFCGEWTNK